MSLTWFKGSDIYSLLGFQSLSYIKELRSFRDTVKVKKRELYCQRNREGKILLLKFQAVISDPDNFFIAHALLRLDAFKDIYQDVIDRQYYSGDIEGRVKLFYKIFATSGQNKVIKRKL